MKKWISWCAKRLAVWPMVLAVTIPSTFAQLIHQKTTHIDLKEVTNICSSFKLPGSCPTGAAPIALVTYDPLVFSKRTGEMKENFMINREVAGESDCYLIKKDLEAKGFCIEGLAVEHSSSIRNAIADQPQLAGRYNYLANVTHGLPGAWVTRGQCESEAKKICMSQYTFTNIEDFNNCVEDEMANPNQSSCPCHKEYNFLNTIHNNYRQACETPHFQSLLNIIGQQELAEFEYANCQKNPANMKFYSEQGDPGVYGRLVSPVGKSFVYAVSCDTAKDPQKTVSFKNEFCRKAPDGTRFNMARTPTFAAYVIDAESARLYQIDKIIKECSTGVCTTEEAKISYDKLLATKANPVVKNYTNGDFVCFECNKGAAISTSCDESDFPEGINYKGEKKEKRAKN